MDTRDEGWIAELYFGEYGWFEGLFLLDVEGEIRMTVFSFNR